MSDELVALELARSVPLDPAALAGSAREHLVLATCERLELYLCGAARIPALSERALRVRRGRDAALHLLRVAGGLESRLVGEPQIQGQLRVAFLDGLAKGSVGPVLGALARAALHAGKRVRCETGLGRRPSVVTLTLARLSRQLDGLRRRAVLVAGTGALAADLLPALRGAGASRLYVLSRSRARAAAFAGEQHATSVADQDVARLPELDAIVCCTDRRLSLAPAATAGARSRPLAIIDLGEPPNVDAAEAASSRAVLTRLAELDGGGEDPATRAAVAAAERLLESELQRFLGWRRARALHAAERGRTAA